MHCTKTEVQRSVGSKDRVVAWWGLHGNKQTDRWTDGRTQRIALPFRL